MTEQLLNELMQIMGKLNQNDRLPRCFGSNTFLYQSEIHLIDAIAPGEGLNVTRLATKLAITKSAVTQIAEKLMAKGLAVKYKKAGNEKEVFIKLTESGNRSFEAHREFHSIVYKKITEYLNNLTPDQNAVLEGLMQIIMENLPKFRE